MSQEELERKDVIPLLLPLCVCELLGLSFCVLDLGSSDPSGSLSFYNVHSRCLNAIPRGGKKFVPPSQGGLEDRTEFRRPGRSYMRD